MADDDAFSLGEEREESGPSHHWLISLADMSMLLMSFFILLFSMSNMDRQKFSASVSSVQQALGERGKQTVTGSVTAPVEMSALVEQARVKQRLIGEQRRVYDQFRAFAAQQGLDGLVSASLDSGKVTISLPTGVLFPKGDADLTEAGKARLRLLYDFLIKTAGERINIRGFTDDQPPGPASRFRDNWEVSSLRAVAVLRYLVAQGMPSNRLTATGLADLEPLYPNDTPEHRARNQRVEFVLERSIGE
ncbi:MAG: OmpA/MotB family protein [Solidesulfovibrio sp. DCME]|uniref:OmpA/MotB family protein n=1 Tax=Solidesulfovibrio sp. DCME TaxID=3447380 RepID=UPI003D126C44